MNFEKVGKAWNEKPRTSWKGEELVQNDVVLTDQVGRKLVKKTITENQRIRQL